MKKMFKREKKSGSASMVEIIVTAIIFVTAAVGIIATTSAFRPKAAIASKELTALYQAKTFLHGLRSQVSADPALFVNGCSPLPPGSYSNSFGDATWNVTIDYNIVKSNVLDIDSDCSIDMLITWPD